MKKALRNIVLTVMAIASIFALVSCGSGKININKVANTLSRNGYTVEDSRVEDSWFIYYDPSVTREISTDDYYFQMTEYVSDAIAKIEYTIMRDLLRGEIKYTKNKIKKYTEMLNDYNLSLTEEQIDDFNRYIDEYNDYLEILQKTEIGRAGNVVWYCADEEILDLIMD